MKRLSVLAVLIFLGLFVFFRVCLPPEKKPAFALKLNPVTLRDDGKLALLRQLKLTGRQKRLLRQSKARYRKDDARIDSEIGLKKAELENELENENPDMDRVDSLCKQMGFLFGRKLRAKLSYQLEIERKILTPGQEAEVEDYRDEGNSGLVNVALSE